MHAQMKMLERGNVVEGFEDIATELDADIPAKGLQGMRFAKGQEQQSIEKLATAGVGQVVAIGAFGLVAGADSLEDDFAQILGIVVVAGDKSIETAGEVVNVVVVGRIVVVGEDNVEAAVETLGGEIAKVTGDEGEGDEVCDGSLGRGGLAEENQRRREAERRGGGERRGGTEQERRRTCLKMSFCTSRGRCKMVGEDMAPSVSNVVVVIVAVVVVVVEDMARSANSRSRVRAQMSSRCNVVTGPTRNLRREADGGGRAGMRRD